MDEEFIARLIALVERSNIAELELSQNGARLRIVKEFGVTAVRQPAQADDQNAEPPAPAGSEGVEGERGPPRRHEIRAGFPGTFFRGPAPGQPPFVELGERAEDGRQLGIVEAMKTMNPLECDRAGRVAAILVEDGTPVEAGTPLFVIEPDG